MKEATMIRWAHHIPTLLLTLTSSLILAGWLFNQEKLIGLHFDLTVMVFNTALCFTSAGLALLIPDRFLTWQKRILIGVALFIFLFCALIAFQDISNRNLGLDQYFIHVKINDDNPNPGRMAPLTIICFFLSATLLILLSQKRSYAFNIFFQFLVISLLLLSITGIAAASIRLDLIYDWNEYSRMALPTAINFLLLTGGLWLYWYRQEACPDGFLNSEDKRIGVTGIIILCLVALGAGLSGFGILAHQMEHILEASLLDDFSNHSKLVQNAIDTAINDAEPVSTRLLLNRGLILLNTNTQDKSAQEEIQEDVNTFLGPDFSGIAVYSINGQLVAQAGSFIQDPDLRVALYSSQLNKHADLIWKNGAFLQIQINILSDNEKIGTVVVEHSLPTLTGLLSAKDLLGESAETRICFALDETNMSCLPSLRRPEIVFNTPRRLIDSVTSMDLALHKESGLRISRDYLKHQVITADGPIGDLGLAMVVKIDTAEFYGPVREKLHYVIFLLIILGCSGVFLQRIQLVPLIKRLVKSEQRLKAIMENVADGIITMTEEGIIESTNRGFLDMFGFTEKQTLGQNISILIPEFITEKQKNDDATHSLLRSFERSHEISIHHVDGREMTVLLAISEMSVGLQNYIVLCIRDISQRKENERIKEEFISTVSHELRTPLTSIRGSLGLLNGSFGKKLPENTQQKLIEIADKNTQRLILLINDILDIDKIAAGRMRFDMRSYAVAALVRQAVEANRSYAQNFDVHIGVDEIDICLMINVDVDRFMQAFSNLLSNAVKFSPSKSIIKVFAVALNGAIRICVADNGPGITNEFRNRIFDKFSQADTSATRSKNGTGLGLHITKQLVEHMGGTIGFEANQDSGTIFWLEFQDVGFCMI